MAETRQWHCMVKGQKYGPVSEAELRAWVGQGRLGYRDAVWTEGMGQWRPLHEVQHMFAAGSPVPPGAAAPVYQPHRGVVILVLGILAIVIYFLGLILGGIAWHMGNEELRRMDAGLSDPTGRGMVTAGKICGIIGFCIGMVGCCGMALWFTAFFGMVGAQGF